MDISVIDAKKTTADHGIIIGGDTAPAKMIEFMNLRCPYCKQWFEESYELLESAVKNNKVQRVIKLFNKEKESLQRGNVMHQYVSRKNPQQALADIAEIFSTQSEWGDLSLEDVAVFAEERLQLKKQDSNGQFEEIAAEADAANIKFVPTVIVNEHIFDESVTKEQLAEYLEPV